MTLYTIGYEGRSIEPFIADLRAHGVHLLADVREAPISRKRGFSKNGLAEALRHASIEYRHLRALGCPKAIRDAHRADGDWGRYTRDFLQHLARQQSALDELSALARQQTTAVMCFEADFNRCHRTYVARALPAQMPVVHITASGAVPDVPGR